MSFCVREAIALETLTDVEMDGRMEGVKRIEAKKTERGGKGEGDRGAQRVCYGNVHL